MREDWRERAACLGVVEARGNHELFFGTEDNRSNRPVLTEGKQRCAACPVVVDCLEFAELVDETYGTYGGLDQEERRRFRNNYGSVRSPRGRAAHQRLLNMLRETVPKGT